MIPRFVGVAALSLALSAPLCAQTNTTTYHTLVPTGVVYQQFTVTSAGVFDLFTSPALTTGSTPFDPFLYLFRGAGTAGTLVGADDDGCFGFLTQCGPADSFANAILDNISLSVGTYTVAVGGYFLSEENARDGVNEGNGYAGDYSLRLVSSIDVNGAGVPLGVATFDTVVAPEPTSVAMLAFGLAAVAMVTRRRRTR